MIPVIMTASGRYFDFLNPTPDSFSIRDIAAALSKLCRFTGHTREFYSVAQHAVLVSHLVPRELALTGLLHDASEAFIGDVSSPLKRLLPEFSLIEERVERVIAHKYGLESSHHPAIKAADVQALALERQELMPPNPSKRNEWGIISGVDTFDIRHHWTGPQLPPRAEKTFLDRYHQLMEDL